MSALRKSHSPWMWIVAGPNGAGKTTFSLWYLPKVLGVFRYINSDYLAAGLSPLAPYLAPVQSGKLSISILDGYVRQKESFAIETTLSSRYHAKVAKRLKADKWKIGLIYLWLESPETAVKRVEERVKKGGHAIPKPVVLRRYGRGLEALNRYQELADRWMVFDNSGPEPKIIASYDGKKDARRIFDPVVYGRIHRTRKGNNE